MVHGAGAADIPWVPFTKVGHFSETAYLDRYGFIPDTIIPGKKALPIGFAKGGPMLDPRARCGATRAPRRT